MEPHSLTFYAYATYFADSGSTQMVYRVLAVPPTTALPPSILLDRQIELLEGCGTPAMVATPLIRDALIAWQRAIYRAHPF